MKRFLLVFLSLSISFLVFAAKKSPKQYLDEALKNFEAGKLEVGQKLMKENEQDIFEYVSNSKKAIAHLKLGKALYFLKKSDDAFALLEEAIKLDPKMADAYFYSGLVIRDTGYVKEAKDFFLQALEAEERDNYFMELGRAYAFEKNIPAALESFKNASRLNSKNTQAHYFVADIYFSQRNNEDAKKYYFKVIKNESEHYEANFNLGLIFQRDTNYKTSLKHFKRCQKIKPDDFLIWNKLVQVYQALGEKIERNKALQKIYELKNKKEELKGLRFFNRDEFYTDTYIIYTLELFKLEKEFGQKYVFRVYDKGFLQPKFDLSLNSFEPVAADYKFENNITTPGVRIFHLDRDDYNDKITRYAYYKKLPGYEKVKDLVLKILDGQAKPIE